jgi:hypothetical protein
MPTAPDCFVAEVGQRHPPLSSSAKADDPVIAGPNCPALVVFTGCPACAGHDRLPGPENRAGFRKREVNPGKPKTKTNFGTPALSLVHALRAILLRRTVRVFLEPAMNKMLVASLLTAFAVNVACLIGHL